MFTGKRTGFKPSDLVYILSRYAMFLYLAPLCVLKTFCQNNHRRLYHYHICFPRCVERLVWKGLIPLTPTSVTPVHHCNTTIKVASWFVACALPLNSLLFYLRARGVFYESKLAVWAFFALWLTTFASFTAPFAFEATQLGPTNWCVTTVVKHFSAASFVTVALFDTMIFFAISLQVSLKRSGDWKVRMKSFFTGKGIGRVSTSLLQTGQLYYM